jgi:hypothetical protein
LAEAFVDLIWHGTRESFNPLYVRVDLREEGYAAGHVTAFVLRHVQHSPLRLEIIAYALGVALEVIALGHVLPPWREV